MCPRRQSMPGTQGKSVWPWDSIARHAWPTTHSPFVGMHRQQWVAGGQWVQYRKARVCHLQVCTCHTHTSTRGWLLSSGCSAYRELRLLFTTAASRLQLAGLGPWTVMLDIRKHSCTAARLSPGVQECQLAVNAAAHSHDPVRQRGDKRHLPQTKDSTSERRAHLCMKSPWAHSP